MKKVQRDGAQFQLCVQELAGTVRERKVGACTMTTTSSHWYYHTKTNITYYDHPNHDEGLFSAPLGSETPFQAAGADK